MDHIDLQQSVAHMHEALGGALCLDFANTLEPRGGPPPIELPSNFDLRDELASYGDLVAWAVHKGDLGFDAAESLLALATRDVAGATSTLERAHLLRDAIYRAFWNIANGEAPATGDLSLIGREYADATAHAVLVADDSMVKLDWAGNGVFLARPLWTVARSTVDLLTTGDPKRIKVCPGPGRPPISCAWLFYDTSKNGSRRWCSMSDCGAATKARIQTERRRNQRATRR